jgi:6-pyruvoyltetrahydropterin/6-carboxytetrahydropterin synthase
LAAQNRHLTYDVSETEIEVKFGKRRYIFPLVDVIQLPIENTTAELLARYISNRFVHVLEEKKLIRGDNIRSVQVEVEESSGQRAIYFSEKS